MLFLCRLYVYRMHKRTFINYCLYIALYVCISVCLYILRCTGVLLWLAFYLLLWPSPWAHQAKHVCNNFFCFYVSKYCDWKFVIVHWELKVVKSPVKARGQQHFQWLGMTAGWGPGHMLQCFWYISRFVDLCILYTCIHSNFIGLRWRLLLRPDTYAWYRCLCNHKPLRSVRSLVWYS